MESRDKLMQFANILLEKQTHIVSPSIVSLSSGLVIRRWLLCWKTSDYLGRGRRTLWLHDSLSVTAPLPTGLSEISSAEQSLEISSILTVYVALWERENQHSLLLRLLIVFIGQFKITHKITKHCVSLYFSSSGQTSWYPQWIHKITAKTYLTENNYCSWTAELSNCCKIEYAQNLGQSASFSVSLYRNFWPRQIIDVRGDLCISRSYTILSSLYTSTFKKNQWHKNGNLWRFLS
jgi:hypothetical protein